MTWTNSFYFLIIASRVKTGYSETEKSVYKEPENSQEKGRVGWRTSPDRLRIIKDRKLDT